MRLGILNIGPKWQQQDEIAAHLRERDIDVILPEDNPLPAEILRLSRADCDGVLLAVQPGASALGAEQIALHLPGPKLLLGPVSPALFDMAGALQEAGALFDRDFLNYWRNIDTPYDLADSIEGWLTDNQKSVRQKGAEAAQKLYGERLAVVSSLSHPLDAAQWLHQFGIIVEQVQTAPGPDDGYTMITEDGDAYGALCCRLLCLIAGEEATIRTIDIDVSKYVHVAETETTFLRIGRRRGRFVAIVVAGALNKTDDNFAGLLMAKDYFSGRLHGVFGDYLSVVDAALETLDIEKI